MQGPTNKGRTVITGVRNTTQTNAPSRIVQYGKEGRSTTPSNQQGELRDAPTRYGRPASRSGDGGNGQAPVSNQRPGSCESRRHLVAIICTTQRPQKPAAGQRQTRQKIHCDVRPFSTARAPPQVPRPPVRKPYTYQRRRPAPRTGSWALCVREHSGLGGAGAIGD